MKTKGVGTSHPQVSHADVRGQLISKPVFELYEFNWLNLNQDKKNRWTPSPTSYSSHLLVELVFNPG